MGGPISNIPRTVSTAIKTEPTSDTEGPGKSKLNRSNAFRRDARDTSNTSAKRESDKTLSNEATGDIKHSKGFRDKIKDFFSLIKKVIVSNLPFRGTATPDAATTKSTTMAGSAVAAAKSAPLTEQQKAVATANVETMINKIKQEIKDDGSTPGLFRKPGTQSTYENMIKNITTQNIPEDTSVNDHCSALKKYLGIMSPATNTDFQELKSALNSEPEDTGKIQTTFKNAIARLPENDRNQINMMVNFLSECYSRAADNNTDQFNKGSIVTSMAPRFFENASDAGTLGEISTTNRLVTSILKNWTPSTAAPAG